MNDTIAAPAITTEWTEIRRDGEYVAAMPTANVLAWFHWQHSYSMDHALTHEGYTLHEVPERHAVSYSLGTDAATLHKTYPTFKGAQRVAIKLFNALVAERPAGQDYRIETEAQTQRLINGVWQAV